MSLKGPPSLLKGDVVWIRAEGIASGFDFLENDLAEFGPCIESRLLRDIVQVDDEP
jgi:hypothetical protein